VKPSRIFIVRHGESHGNVDRSIYRHTPDYAVQLTDKGRTQAVEAGERIARIVNNKPQTMTKPSIQFYGSSFWRTRQTFLGIRKGLKNVLKDHLRSQYYEDPRLREQEWSARLQTDNKTAAVEEERDQFGHFYYRFKMGESCADTYDRVSDFMGTMFRDFEKPNFPRNAVVITHGMTMRVFMMRWFHCTVEEFESWGNPWNCEILILQRTENERYELITPMKLHVLRHEYQFDWGDSPEFGARKVPFRTQQEPIYPE
jgi:broad specificity phosphatase PhoE